MENKKKQKNMRNLIMEEHEWQQESKLIVVA